MYKRQVLCLAGVILQTTFKEETETDLFGEQAVLCGGVCEDVYKRQAQYIRHTKSRGFITSGGLGTMGFGYGAAIGAQMALGRDCLLYTSRCV